jgi:hypothetical protein
MLLTASGAWLLAGGWLLLVLACLTSCCFASALAAGRQFPSPTKWSAVVPGGTCHVCAGQFYLYKLSLRRFSSMPRLNAHDDRGEATARDQFALPPDYYDSRSNRSHRATTDVRSIHPTGTIVPITATVHRECCIAGAVTATTPSRLFS